jgi:CopA family copper-resistance protein
MKLKIISLMLLFIIPGIIASASVREYNLVISFKSVNFSGRDTQAMTINGSIPGPTLRFKHGDTARIHVRNEMDEETSIHWHGVLLPNFQDGVPYVTTPPIMPGTTFTYEFPIKHSGTYWYHSHTGLQEQRGVYGSIVIESRAPGMKTDIDHVMVLSDWTDENPDEVLRLLKSGSDYYSLKKGSMQSLSGAIRADALRDVFQRSLMRMPPMDVSDIAYDGFLVNGQPSAMLEARPGNTVRLRIINAAASSYFYLQYAGGSMRVVSADGVEVKPVDLNRLLISVAETYDVIITVPDIGAYEFRATAQDGSGHTSLFIGSGERIAAPDVPKPNLYKIHSGHDMSGSEMEGMMKHQDTMSGGQMKGMIMDEGDMSGNQMKGMMMDEGDMSRSQMKGMMMDEGHMSGGQMKGMMMDEGHMDMIERPQAPYDNLRSPVSTALSKDLPIREVRLELTGDMERFVWSINGKTLNEADMIRIKKGENARFILVNKTMMHHPMHLHGHFFRVVNKHGDYSPLKHTFDVPPLGQRVIEFYANEEQDWFFHCHVLYHMKAGMARIVHYEGSELDPQIAAIRPNMFKEHWYAWANASFLTQMTEGEVVAADTRNTLRGTWEAGWDEDYEAVLTYERYFTRFFQAFAGGVLTDGEQDHRGIIGIRYLLPLMLETALWLDTEGEGRFIIDKEIQLTDRLYAFGEFEYDTESDEEWAAGAGWTINRYFSIVGKYHSEYKGGAGLNVRF